MTLQAGDNRLCQHSSIFLLVKKRAAIWVVCFVVVGREWESFVTFWVYRSIPLLACEVTFIRSVVQVRVWLVFCLLVKKPAAKWGWGYQA